jgi:glycosyltransferase involved in cell wall biosynthesis
MRIAMLSVFYPYRGGIAQFGGRLFRELQKAHEVKAFNFSRQYPSLLFPGKTQYVSDSDRVDPLPNERLLDSINPLSWHTTSRAIHSFRPDVLLTRLWMPFLAPSIGFVAGQLKKKVTCVAIIDNLIPHERRMLDSLLTCYFLKRHHGFVVMSRQVASHLQKAVPKARFILCPHPLYDHYEKKISRREACHQLGIPENKKILLYYGFVRKYKGLDLLLDAFLLLEDDYHLIIAGEWYEDSTAFEKRIKPLESRITFLNRYIGMEETRLLFSAADACTLTYLSATQSGVAAVAMHYEVPLMVTPAGGLYEPVKQYGIGSIAIDFTAEAVAHAIRQLFNQQGPERFKPRFEQVKKELSWSRFSHDLITFCEQLKHTQ